MLLWHFIDKDSLNMLIDEKKHKNKTAFILYISIGFYLFRNNVFLNVYA